MPAHRGERGFAEGKPGNGGLMNWLFLNSGQGDAALNMALDEALLEAMGRLQKPALRVYGWREPAATFGLMGANAAALRQAAGMLARVATMVQLPAAAKLLPLTP